MRYKAAYHTDVGIRKKTNQDSLAIKIADTPYGMAAFAVICDGMGGLAKGEVASKEVICAFSDWFQESFAEMIDNDSFDEELMRKQWHSIAVNENEILKAYGEDNGIMIGTTLTAMLMFRDSYYIIHVGDSRAYEITGTEARQLTNDQTFVAREVAAGRMTPEQAEVDSRRSVLLQCIGASPVVEPDFIKGEVVGDAVYMLCSDGFRHNISNEEMIERIGPAADVDDDALTTGCQFLTELDKYRKETDNITVLCIRTTP